MPLPSRVSADFSSFAASSEDMPRPLVAAARRMNAVASTVRGCQSLQQACSCGLSLPSQRRRSSSARTATVLRSVEDVRAWRNEQRRAGKSVGFVPTMGSLHDGHLNLVRRSVAACDASIVSIFVNPAQFAPTEDLATYPRESAMALSRSSSRQCRR